MHKIDFLRIRGAFDKISEAGIKRFHDKVFDTYDNIAWKFKTEAFHLIKLTAFISKL